MVIKWRCSNCGALHGTQEAIGMMLSKNFIPVNVEEQPKPVPQRIPKPIPKLKQEPKEEEFEPLEEEDDLSLPEGE